MQIKIGEKIIDLQKNNLKIVDLSLPLTHEMPVNPEDPRIGFINFTNLTGVIDERTFIY